MIQLEYGEKIGLGRRVYTLIQRYKRGLIELLRPVNVVKSQYPAKELTFC